MQFQLRSDYEPTGDQPEAIQQLTQGINRGERAQVLLGVTGSGKTFSVANVIQNVNKPTLVLSHNKTLAAQLYGELKHFFPDNAVEYFISYYDYYQPEAYLPTSDTYIEKDLSINEEIEKLRLRATSALMSGRRDVIVVSSVSCIYGIGNPEEFGKHIVSVAEGDQISRNKLLHNLVTILYSRSQAELQRGTFRVKGDTVDIYPAYADFAYRIYFWDDEIEAIHRIDSVDGKKISGETKITIFPANLFIAGQDMLGTIIEEIQDDLVVQIKKFEEEGRNVEAQRVKERTEFDLEMIRELGYCSGIENYSRYFDRRKPGTRPFCLLDYFPDDYLMVIDESHVTIPQIRGMWGGDRSRKTKLVDYGFRLPAAMDNRPLQFDEFESLVNQVIYVSATPGDYELRQTEGVVAEQVIRPTGLLDPEIEVKPSQNQIDDLLEEVRKRTEQNERVLVTTLTKRMAEELDNYLANLEIRSRYIHSDIDSLDRVDILRDLRSGNFDVLVGVNLLREGLDLPEVSLVAIIDADKEGFLRNERSLIQTMGRAARNVNGKVIMYADTVTDSMQKAIDETYRRRAKQQEYNEKHDIQPQTIQKSMDVLMTHEGTEEGNKDQQKGKEKKFYAGHEEEGSLAADPVVNYMSREKLEKLAKETEKQMEKEAKDLNFMEAARLRDELSQIRDMLEKDTQKDT